MSYIFVYVCMDARACLEGIRLDAVWSRLPVIMVSDSDFTSVIQALEGNEHCISRLGAIFSEIQREAETLTGCKFVLAKREQIEQFRRQRPLSAKQESLVFGTLFYRR